MYMWLAEMTIRTSTGVLNVINNLWWCWGECRSFSSAERLVCFLRWFSVMFILAILIIHSHYNLCCSARLTAFPKWLPWSSRVRRRYFPVIWLFVVVQGTSYRRAASQIWVVSFFSKGVMAIRVLSSCPTWPFVFACDSGGMAVVWI